MKTEFTELDESKLAMLVERLKANDPQFDLRVELGTLLMTRKEDFTPQQTERFNELCKILNIYNPC